MTALALSLFILACGWKFIKDWRFTRYAALKNAGHPQYFGAAIAAAYIGCLSASIHDLFLGWSCYQEAVQNGISYLPSSPKNLSEAKAISGLAAIAAWAFFLSCFLSWIFNHFLFKDPRLLVAVARKVGAVDELEALCQRCLETGILLAVTLKSGKVYVGVPEGYSPMDSEKKWLAIWPMASGFRNERHELDLTTFYSPQYEIAASQEDSLGADDYRVVLPRAEISSAQSFDLETYESFGVLGASDPLPEGQGNSNLPEGQENSVEAMIDAVNASGELGHEVIIDNASELTAEIIPPEDVTLLRIYFGFVLSASALLLLVSGTWWWIAAALATAYFFVRLRMVSGS